MRGNSSAFSGTILVTEELQTNGLVGKKGYLILGLYMDNEGKKGCNILRL